MNAGLPGTGIGGLLYAVLALLMLLRELYLTARGRGSRERWRLVLQQLLIACGIVGSIVATGRAFSRVVDTRETMSPSGASIFLAPALAAVLVLGVLVAGLRVWALLVPNRARRHALSLVEPVERQRVRVETR